MLPSERQYSVITEDSYCLHPWSYFVFTWEFLLSECEKPNHTMSWDLSFRVAPDYPVVRKSSGLFRCALTWTWNPCHIWLVILCSRKAGERKKRKQTKDANQNHNESSKGLFHTRSRDFIYSMLRSPQENSFQLFSFSKTLWMVITREPSISQSVLTLKQKENDFTEGKM